MGIISWIILGLVVGVIAKFIMPGKDPGGIFITILLGIAGAIGGGLSAPPWVSARSPALTCAV